VRRAVLALVTTAAGLVLLLGFKTQPMASPATPPAAISGSGTDSAASSGSSTGSTSSSTATRSVTGAAADTRFGPVQVQVTLRGFTIVSATAVDYPASNPRDAQINSYAIPVLNQEAVSANSANIDMVSGATFTSMGYLQSLQSALDKAKA
jgi:hypothetical protein